MLSNTRVSAPVRFTLLAAIAVTALLIFSARADARLYWSDFSSSVGRVDVDGGNPQPTFITGGSETAGLAVSGTNIYWANGSGGSIGRANLDGTGVDQAFISGLPGIQSIAIDEGHIYWTNVGTQAIGRANLDGTEIEPEFIKGIECYFGLAVVGEHIFWINNYNSIGRADIDGTNVEEEFIPNLGGISSYGMYANSEYIYWADNSGTTIGRARIDGTEVETSFIVGLNQPGAIAVDGHYIYFTNDETETIGRADLDGSAVVTNLVANTGYALGLAADVSQPTLTSAASPDVVFDNGTISDTATLAEGGGPGGTLTFSLYGPNDATCSGTPVLTQATRVKGNGAYISPEYLPRAVGTYRWTVSYSGDFGNLPASVACGAPGTVTEVTPPPTYRPTVKDSASPGFTIGSGSLTDTATLSGAVEPAGTITFRLYGPDDPHCSGVPLLSAEAKVTSNGTFSSPAYSPTKIGTYRWSSTYSGSAYSKGTGNNLPASGSCDEGSAATKVVPPNAFATLKVTGRKKAKGTAKLGVYVAWQGTVTVSGPGIRRQTKSVSAAGNYRLSLRPNAAFKKRLKHRRRAFTRVTVSFQPTDGEAAPATTLRTRLVLRIRKH